MANLLDLATQPEPKEAPEPLAREASLAGDFMRSVVYSGVQSPVDGLTQLVDKTTGSNLLPHVQFLEAPQTAEFGSARWHAQQVGGAVGMMAPFLLLHKGMHRGGLRTAAMEVRATTLTGTVYGAGFVPVGQEEDFLAGRLRNAAVLGATFGTLSASAVGLKTLGQGLAPRSVFASSVLKNEVGAGILSGAPAGAVHADAHSLLSGHGLAGTQERLQSMYTFSMIGAAFGGKHMLERNLKTSAESGSLASLAVKPERQARAEIEIKPEIKPEIEARPEKLTAQEIAELSVAQRADGKDGHWKKLYDEAFPDSEAFGKDAFQALIDKGEVKLFETRNKQGELVHFTLLEIYPAGEGKASDHFLLNSYTATRADMRGRGIGSVHLARALKELKAEYTESMGVLAEIESPKEPGLDATEMHWRQKRLDFYENLGFRNLEKFDFLSPSWVEGEAPLPMNLIFYPFKSPTIKGANLADSVARLYNYGYEMDPSNPFIASQVAKINPQADY